jgi:hypothetical protein
MGGFTKIWSTPKPSVSPLTDNVDGYLGSAMALETTKSAAFQDPETVKVAGVVGFYCWGLHFPV